MSHLPSRRRIAPTFPVADGRWQLAPEGAALHTCERLAVVSDVHLGYEWARAAGGDCVPVHSLDETLDRLARLLLRGAIERLVVAGDLVESPRPCPRTNVDLAHLTAWLCARGVSLIHLAGNHDPRRVPPLPESIEAGGWTIAHGHVPVAAARCIVGHEHPVLRAAGVTAPCFLVGDHRIVLPAFSPNAAGCNVASCRRSQPAGWRDASLRCVVASGSEWLDFGPVHTLSQRLGRRPARHRGV
jgi:putative SbcD/Mre11-related phosphoesterase